MPRTGKTPHWLHFAADPTNPDGGGKQPETVTPPAPADPAATDPGPGQPDPGAPSSDPPSLGDAGKKALSEERKARRDAEKALAATQAKVKEYEQRDLSEHDRLTQQLADATRRAETAETDALRLRIATEVGLDPDLHEFLDGITDEEQMRARATKLAAKAAPGTPSPPDFGAGKRGDDPTSLASLDQQIDEALKNGDVRQSLALKRRRQQLVDAGKK